MRTHTCKYPPTCTQTHTPTHLHKHTHTHPPTYTQSHTQTHTPTHLHTHTEKEFIFSSMPLSRLASLNTFDEVHHFVHYGETDLIYQAKVRFKKTKKQWRSDGSQAAGCAPNPCTAPTAGRLLFPKPSHRQAMTVQSLCVCVCAYECVCVFACICKRMGWEDEAFLMEGGGTDSAVCVCVCVCVSV